MGTHKQIKKLNQSVKEIKLKGPKNLAKSLGYTNVQVDAPKVASPKTAKSNAFDSQRYRRNFRKYSESQGYLTHRPNTPGCNNNF